MMDRGSFNGPGGPHSRWVVPATQGASMPAGLMLRNRIHNGFITTNQILRLNRDGLAKSGSGRLATVTARAVERRNPANWPASSSPLTAPLRTTALRPMTPPPTPFPPAVPLYNNYTLEVVQRLGYDSFCPDSGVLLAKNKDREGRSGGPNPFNLFSWVIDAHPEDIHQIDFIRPKSHTPVYRTVADYRQLNDALFHAGMNSGSQYEYEDAYNRLHFYVIDVKRDAAGILSYTLGVRSLDGSGPQTRGVDLTAPSAAKSSGSTFDCSFVLKNTGQPNATDASLHPQDASAYLTTDIYRLSVSVDGAGWTAQIPNALTAVEFGKTASIPVHLYAAPGTTGSTPTVTLMAKSESDPSKSATATFQFK
jgi:hypothetical protein